MHKESVLLELERSNAEFGEDLPVVTLVQRNNLFRAEALAAVCRACLAPCV